MLGLISTVTVSLLEGSGNVPDDIDILLVAPDGVRNTILMSNTGGLLPFNDVNLLFDDNSAGMIPDDGPLVTGIYKPTNYGPISNLPAPAPPSNPVVALSNFNGLPPNGTWRLFVAIGDSSQSIVIEEGWVISLTTVETEECLYTPL